MDCVLHIFEKLDIQALCAVAGTSKKLQSIARKFFGLRKLTRGYFVCLGDSRDDSVGLKRVQVSDPLLFKNILKQFGEYLRIISIGVCNDSLSIFKYIEKYCSGGTLQSLKVRGDLDIEQLIDVDMSSLFKHLQNLQLHFCTYDMLKYPFGVCEALVSINIQICDEKLVADVLKHEFPSLKSLKMVQQNIPQGLLDKFLSMHTKLIVLLSAARNEQYSSLEKMTNLERLMVFETNSMMRRTIGRMPLKHFAPQIFNSRDHFLEFVRSSSVLRDHLEVFSTTFAIGNAITDDEVLTGILTFRALLELRIFGTANVCASRIISVLEQLIANLPVI